MTTWARTSVPAWMPVNPLPSLPFCSTQRKNLDLNLQSATAPSRGKTLPTPVQLGLTHSADPWLKPCLLLVLTCVLCVHIAIRSRWIAWKSRNKQPRYKKRRWSSCANHTQIYVRCMHWSCKAPFPLQISQGTWHVLYMLYSHVVITSMAQLKTKVERCVYSDWHFDGKNQTHFSLFKTLCSFSWSVFFRILIPDLNKAHFRLDLLNLEIIKQVWFQLIWNSRSYTVMWKKTGVHLTISLLFAQLNTCTGPAAMNLSYVFVVVFSPHV